jgi:hypothetical protein
VNKTESRKELIPNDYLLTAIPAINIFVIIFNKNKRKKGPWKLIFIRSFTDKKEALAFERQLKKWRNKNYIRRQFKEYFL